MSLPRSRFTTSSAPTFAVVLPDALLILNSQGKPSPDLSSCVMPSGSGPCLQIHYGTPTVSWVRAVPSFLIIRESPGLHSSHPI